MGLVKRALHRLSHAFGWNAVEYVATLYGDRTIVRVSCATCGQILMEQNPRFEPSLTIEKLAEMRSRVMIHKQIGYDSCNLNCDEALEMIGALQTVLAERQGIED